MAIQFDARGRPFRVPGTGPAYKKVLKKATKKVKKTVARRGQGRGGRESSGST